MSGMIRFDNVSMRYGGGDEILKGLSFGVSAKSFQFLTGASGAGKTSILRLLFMDLKPTSGSISLFNKDTSELTQDEQTHIRQKIGIVFQNFWLINHLTLYENVALPLRVRGKNESEYKNDVSELIKWVGLEDKINELPPTMSGGEKQRAAIARAIIDKPELLLADEPTGNLDPELSRRLLRLFVELNKSGTSVIIATHDLTLMDQYDARRMVLDNGYIQIYD